jgi:hypothetical protein
MIAQLCNTQTKQDTIIVSIKKYNTNATFVKDFATKLFLKETFNQCKKNNIIPIFSSSLLFSSKLFKLAYYKKKFVYLDFRIYLL